MKTISATEAKNRLGSFLGQVAQGDDDVVIESHGKPTAVLVAFEVYRALREAEDELRRRKAMDELRQLRADVRARNQDLSVEEADAIAEELTSEAVANVIARARQRKQERLGLSD